MDKNIGHGVSLEIGINRTLLDLMEIDIESHISETREQAIYDHTESMKELDAVPEGCSLEERLIVFLRTGNTIEMPNGKIVSHDDLP